MAWAARSSRKSSSNRSSVRVWRSSSYRSTAGARERYVVHTRQHRTAPRGQGLVQRVPVPPRAARWPTGPGPGRPAARPRARRRPRRRPPAQALGARLEGRPGAVGAYPLHQRVECSRRRHECTPQPGGHLVGRHLSPGVSASIATRARSRLPVGVRSVPSTSTCTVPSSPTRTIAQRRAAAGAGRSPGGRWIEAGSCRARPTISLERPPGLRGVRRRCRRSHRAGTPPGRG